MGYPGMEGGHAIADVLSGRVSPCGRLPVAFPEREADLGPFERTARRVRYDRWWGQRRLDRDGVAAAYPFGYGLGYTTFALRDARRGEGGVEVTVENTGERDGVTVVQVYAVREVRALVGFARVDLAPGERTEVRIATRPVARFDPATKRWLPPLDTPLEVALYRGDPRALRVERGVN